MHQKNGGDISALESQGKYSQSNPALCTILLRTEIGPHCFISFTFEVTRKDAQAYSQH